jgi:hypothetical protein
MVPATFFSGKTQERSSIIRGLLNLAGRKFVAPTIRDGLNALSEVIEGEIANGKVYQQTAVKVSRDLAENALAEGLVQI